MVWYPTVDDVIEVNKLALEESKDKQKTENKKNPNTEFFREAIRENIELMRALAKNGRNK